MDDNYISYKSQCKNAKETLVTLEKYREEIDFKLISDPSNAHLHKDLRTVNMDIRITENEIEHCELRIKEYESKYNSSMS